MLGVPSHHRWYQVQGREMGNISDGPGGPNAVTSVPVGCRQREDGHTQRGGPGEMGRGGMRGHCPRGWRRQGGHSPRRVQSRWSSGQEGVGVARDGGRGRKGRGGMGGRTKPCGASEGPALARRELEGLRGRAIKAALGPRKTCLRIPGVPADCWRWHPVPQHLCCAPGPRRAPPPSLPPTLPKDRQGGTQLDVGFLEDVSRFLTSAAHGMCAGELSM